MMWFDCKDSRAVFVDKRRETHRDARTPETKGWRENERTIEVNPDQLADFTALPFLDNSFALVVFDPPHFERSGKKGWLANKYGWLEGDWRTELRKGFAECFRVLKPEGTLIFKWTATENPVSEILKLTPMKPLFGHKSGKQAQTHWIAFLKPNDKVSRPAAE